ncbi:hypothetical protein Ddye_022873 [Dipteronia dyeriana]|uniref:CCHC-type domain-containing protein n=1 Tax=Dipteronia dyeriana TaxID=168575 RepID=A0AAD9TSU3_9ROSI|nr:hypothetical protein Ddye_022873 [Dipteronia dyeriana]
MLVATAQDRNERVYPIAFGYGDSENKLSCGWFLDCLKGALGHIDDLVFIYDRHASTKARISKTTTRDIRLLTRTRFLLYRLDILPPDIVERVVLNTISRRQAKRPRAGRHISSLERTTTQSCRRCGQPNHNFRRCSNLPLINEGPSRVIPKEYCRKCSICHSVGHNKQTCPNRDSTVE